MFRSSNGNFDKLLDKATSHLRMDPDWPAIMQLCDCIRQGDCLPKNAIAAVKKKLASTNPHTALYSVLVLESLVKNCGILIQDEIATKQFMEYLRDYLKSNKHEMVQEKILGMIQAWSHAFRSNPKYRAVQDGINIIKADGYNFPPLKESDAMFSADSAPDWVDADVCNRCRIGFTLVIRKHHCRACGNVFCNHCSNKTSTIPKFGIEKEVRVCDTCYEQNHRPAVVSASQPKESATAAESLPAEYLTSSLAQQSQQPKHRDGKSEQELKEEEEFQLALALSQSEAEAKENEKKRATKELMMMNTGQQRGKSPTISKTLETEEEPEDPELAIYLNRSYWEQKNAAKSTERPKNHMNNNSNHQMMMGNEKYRNSPPSAPETPIHLIENGISESELTEFVSHLRNQVEIFVNRMKSNSSRGRSIANDSSVQKLFVSVTENHSKLLKYIREQDDLRLRYEALQDKLAQVKDAQGALQALRDEHLEKLRREAEEAERQKQLQMAAKLQIMRKKKQDYLQQQREYAIQRVQEQEREMQLRKEQQRQQYLMNNYPYAYQYSPNPPQPFQPQQQQPYAPAYATPPMQSPMSLPPRLPMPPMMHPMQMPYPATGNPMAQFSPAPRGPPLPPGVNAPNTTAGLMMGPPSSIPATGPMSVPFSPPAAVGQGPPMPVGHQGPIPLSNNNSAASSAPPSSCDSTAELIKFD